MSTLLCCIFLNALAAVESPAKLMGGPQRVEFLQGSLGLTLQSQACMHGPCMFLKGLDKLLTFAGDFIHLLLLIRLTFRKCRGPMQSSRQENEDAQVEGCLSPHVDRRECFL